MMRDLTDFEKGHIIGVRMVGASIIKTAELFGFSITTISGPCQNSKNTARPPNIGAALVGLLR